MEVVFYVSMILFLISILGLFIASDMVSLFISRQIMIASSVVSFLNFSMPIAPPDAGIKIMLVLGLVTFYLFEFSVLFYLYSNRDVLGNDAAAREHRLLSIRKSDWWGEDRL